MAICASAIFVDGALPGETGEFYERFFVKCAPSHSVVPDEADIVGSNGHAIRAITKRAADGGDEAAHGDQAGSDEKTAERNLGGKKNVVSGKPLSACAGRSFDGEGNIGGPGAACEA